MMKTVGTFLAIAGQRNWQIHQMYVFNAILQGDLPDEIYMELPHGFVTRGRIRCVDSLNPFMGGNKHLDSGMQSCLRHY